MTKLLIAGSRFPIIGMREYAIRCVLRAKSLNWDIIVGDNPSGIDKIVIDTCYDNKVKHSVFYSQIIGLRYHSETSNVVGIDSGIQYENPKSTISRLREFTYRDRRMIINADKCMFIWDGISKGTQNGWEYCKDVNKPGWLKDFSDGTLQISRS